jgi:hypothetical protein
MKLLKSTGEIESNSLIQRMIKGKNNHKQNLWLFLYEIAIEAISQ